MELRTPPEPRQPKFQTQPKFLTLSQKNQPNFDPTKISYTFVKMSFPSLFEKNDNQAQKIFYTFSKKLIFGFAGKNLLTYFIGKTKLFILLEKS